MTPPVIDSHQHIWDPARAEYDWLGPALAPLDRAFGPEEALAELRAAGIEHTILVQSADNAADTALMSEAAASHVEIVGIVGYVPLDDPDAAADTVTAWAGDSLLVGGRVLIHNHPDPDYLLRPEVDEGLGILEDAGLTFDIVAELPRHLELVPILSERHPRLRMVIDHLAKPPIGAASHHPWWQLIADAAQNPLVCGKVSGLYAANGDPGDWTPAAVQPFIDRALDVFGADRLMYGGDWPVSIRAGGYARVWAGIQDVLASYSHDEREALLGRTAARFYRLDPARLVTGIPRGGTP